MFVIAYACYTLRLENAGRIASSIVQGQIHTQHQVNINQFKFESSYEQKGVLNFEITDNDVVRVTYPWLNKYCIFLKKS
mgnify:FL=1